MKVAYFDCSKGISGNMILGALLDAGLKRAYLLRELGKLKLKGYKLTVKKGDFSTLVEVKLIKKEKPRNLKDILKIIDSSELSKSVKNTSKKIFLRLAEAESKVHNKPLSKVHFHELGSTDAIIDIVGAAIGLDKLKISKVYSSALNIGKGKIKMAHGTFSVPAPATTYLIKNIPVFSNDIPGELVTPTGAAIITSICDSFRNMPRIEVQSSGSGAGSYKLKTPNTLRVFVGKSELDLADETILQIETGIDDMSPEFYGHVIETLLEAGAVDAYIAPVQMKKGRPASTLTVLAPPDKKDKVLEKIFSETTSFGVRVYLVPRKILKRTVASVNTRFGLVRIKKGLISNSTVTASPEYGDCERIAKKRGIPLKTVYTEALRAFHAAD